MPSNKLDIFRQKKAELEGVIKLAKSQRAEAFNKGNMDYVARLDDYIYTEQSKLDWYKQQISELKKSRGKKIIATTLLILFSLGILASMNVVEISETEAVITGIGEITGGAISKLVRFSGFAVSEGEEDQEGTPPPEEEEPEEETEEPEESEEETEEEPEAEEETEETEETESEEEQEESEEEQAEEEQESEEQEEEESEEEQEEPAEEINETTEQPVNETTEEPEEEQESEEETEEESEEEETEEPVEEPVTEESEENETESEEPVFDLEEPTSKEAQITEILEIISKQTDVMQQQNEILLTVLGDLTGEEAEEPEEEETEEAEEVEDEPEQQEESEEQETVEEVDEIAEEVVEEVNETVEEETLEEAEEVEEELEVIEEPVEIEAPEENATEVIEEVVNETEEQPVEDGAVALAQSELQYSAEILKPVHWKKTVIVDREVDNLTIEIPADAELLNVTEIEEGEKILVDESKILALEGTETVEVDLPETDAEVEQLEEALSADVEVVENSEGFGGLITGNVVLQGATDIWSTFVEWLLDWFSAGRRLITGAAIQEAEGADVQEIIINETVEEVVVEYLTEAPKVYESEIEGGKAITISSEHHYENILAYTDIEEADASTVVIYHRVDGVREKITENYRFVDTNDNGLVDRVEWVVPHLSDQTYEIIIEITEAYHLDENRTFVADIYNETIEKDGIWSETIPEGHYARVTFESNLTSDRDITVFPRAINGTPRIEIFEKDGTTVIAEFGSLVDTQYNKVYLTNLTGSQDTFDLRILDGAVQFDHIIDPAESGQVQRGNASGTATQLNATISSVNTSAAFILFRANTADASPSQRMFTANFSSDTVVTFDKYDVNPTSLIRWQVIESNDLDVQRGHAVFASGNASANVPINAVDLDETFVIITSRCDTTSNSNTNSAFFAGNLTSSTNLLLTRGNEGECDATVNWQVVEWEGAIVQSGRSAILDNTDSITTSINQVNLSRAFLAFSTASIGSDDGVDSNMIQGSFNGDSALFFQHEPGTTYASSLRYIDWFTVELPGASVQNGTTTVVDTTETITSVNTSRSFTISSAWGTAGGQAYQNSDYTINLTNPTLLTIDEATGSGAGEIEWFVVDIGGQFPNLPPTTPTNIQCNDLDNCNISIPQGGTIMLNASGSVDTYDDAITYVISAFYDGVWTNIGNHTETTQVSWDTSNVSVQNGVDLNATAIDLTGSNTFSGTFAKNAFINITGTDSIAPNVTALIPVADSTFNDSTTIELAANVTDNGVISEVMANVRLPNGTVQQVNLSNAVGDKYNSTFTIPVDQLGIYNVTINATDISSNFNDTETTFFNAVAVETVPVQRGTVTSSDLVITDNITTAVPDNSFIRFTANIDDTNPNDWQLTPNITSNRTISFERYANGAPATVSWEVVSRPDLHVQRGQETLAASTASVNVTLNAVDTSESFVIVYGRCADTTTADTHAAFFAADITNSTNLELTRGNEAKCEATVSWQVVEWDDADVQSGETMILDNTDSINVNIDPVDLTKTFLVVTSASTGTDPGQDSNLIQGSFVNSSGLLFTHEPGSTYGNSNRTVNWYVVERPNGLVQSGTQTVSANGNATLTTEVNTSESFTMSSHYASQGGQGYHNSLYTTELIANDTLEFIEATATADTTVEWFVIDMGPILSEVTPPQLVLINPKNVTYNDTFGVPLDYIATDDVSIDSCWYILNGGANVTLPSCANTTFTADPGFNTFTLYTNDTSGKLNSTQVNFTAIANTTLEANFTQLDVAVLEETTFYANYTLSNGSAVQGATCVAEGSFRRFTIDGSINFNDAQEPNFVVHGNNTVKVNFTQPEINLTTEPVDIIVHQAAPALPTDDLRLYFRCDGNDTIDSAYQVGSINKSDAIIYPDHGFEAFFFNQGNVTSETCSYILESSGSNSTNGWYVMEVGRPSNYTYRSTDFGQTYTQSVNESFTDFGYIPFNKTMIFNTTTQLYELPFKVHHGRQGLFTDNVTCTLDGHVPRSDNQTLSVSDNLAPIVQINEITPDPARFGIDSVNVTWAASDISLDTKYVNVTYPNGSLVVTSTDSPLELTIAQLSVAGQYNVTIFANDSSGAQSTTSQNFTVSTAPYIDDISTIPMQLITEGGETDVIFHVLATDTDGVSDLDDSSMNATFFRFGQALRTNSSCAHVTDINSTTANYTCTIGIWYFDAPGVWAVNATVLDVSGQASAAYNESFTIAETTAIVLSPDNLTWDTLFPLDTDELANNPVTINNTGNRNISTGNVRVTSYDLVGATDVSQVIPAANFTVNTIGACEGTVMVNATVTGINGSILTRGNNSAGQGQEQLYYCIEEVPAGITAQTYTNIQSWVVDVV